MQCVGAVLHELPQQAIRLQPFVLQGPAAPGATAACDACVRGLADRGVFVDEHGMGRTQPCVSLRVSALSEPLLKRQHSWLVAHVAATAATLQDSDMGAPPSVQRTREGCPPPGHAR